MSRSDSSTVTTFRDGAGRVVNAAKHLACNGLGCDECGGLGFTRTLNAQPGPGWADVHPPRVNDDAVQAIKAAKEKGR